MNLETMFYCEFCGGSPPCAHCGGRGKISLGEIIALSAPVDIAAKCFGMFGVGLDSFYRTGYARQISNSSIEGVFAKSSTVSEVYAGLKALGMTLENIGDASGYTSERIRQIMVEDGFEVLPVGPLSEIEINEQTRKYVVTRFATDPALWSDRRTNSNLLMQELVDRGMAKKTARKLLSDAGVSKPHFKVKSLIEVYFDVPLAEHAVWLDWEIRENQRGITGLAGKINSVSRVSISLMAVYRYAKSQGVETPPWQTRKARNAAKDKLR